MALAVLAGRLALALVFGVAAFGKLTDRAGSRRALREFGVPERLLGTTTTILPLAELSISAALVITASARVAASSALALLAGFTVAIGATMARGRSPDCHCFGQLHSAPAGPGALARNAALAAIAGLVLIEAPGRSLSRLTLEELALLSAVLAIAALLIARRAPRARPASGPGGLPVASPAPDLFLSSLAGESVALSSVIAPGRPAVLVQLSPDCGPCRALLPEISQWQRALAHELDVVVICSGDLDDSRALAREHEVQTMYVGAGEQLVERYGLRPTPSAVLIDEQGRIGAAPVAGAPAIEALIRLRLQRSSAAV